MWYNQILQHLLILLESDAIQKVQFKETENTDFTNKYGTWHQPNTIPFVYSVIK